MKISIARDAALPYRMAWLSAVVALLAMMALPRASGSLPAGTSLLTVHLLLELFAISIAVLIVTISWHKVEPRTRDPSGILIAGFTIVAACDLLHALSYEGMPDFLGAGSTERAIYYWLLGRSFEVLTLGILAADRVPRFSRWTALATGLGTGALLAWSGSGESTWFPATYVPGAGVTRFKALFEVGLCLANIAVALALWRKARASGGSRHYLMATSAWMIGVGELAFTSYVEPSDFQNIFGHLFKIAAYALLYRATYMASIRGPYDALRASELRASQGEHRIRLMTDNLPNCAIYQRTEEPGGNVRFQYLSESIEQITGVSVAEALADDQSMLGALLPDDRARLIEARDRGLLEGRGYEMTVRIRHRDGGIRWLHVVSSRPRAIEGGGRCWDGLVTDITDSRADEMRLRENEAMLAAVIDSASDGVISTDREGRVSLFNRAAERIFGYSAADILGGGLERLLPERMIGRHGALLAAFGDSGVPSRRMGSGRVTGRRADGAELALEASISQVKVQDRTVVTAILHDVTERVRTERALLQYQQELTELAHRLMDQEKQTSKRLAQALHDQLGQTLAAMRIDFVDEAQLPEAGQAARHARVDRLIDQAIREVRQVLNDVRPTLLDERGLVDALDEELRNPRIPADSVRRQLEAQDELRGVRWTPDVEYAVFLVAREAIGNALRHGHATMVRVVLQGGPDMLEVEITDDGAGFDPEALAARPGHLGVVGMRERSIAIGARFSLRSSPGRGTSVSMRWEDPAE